MYFTTNFKSKAAAKRALAAGEEVFVKRTSSFERLEAGQHSVEGPWYPQPHTFYGTVTIEDHGRVTEIK
jgi:hypothetical protein